MKISEQEKRELEELYHFFLNHEKTQKMKGVQMHRGSNTFLHSFKVAKLAIKRALRHKNVNLKAILIASILHDYYLYDWRTQKEYKAHHAKNHPFIAAENAKKDFGIDEEVMKIIQTHMWPFNIKRFPETTEARIVNFADNRIAFKEALTSRAYKKRHYEKELKFIENLF